VLTDLQARLHVPKPFRVLGLELCPFSLSHALTLEALGLRALGDESDLAVAVLICALPPGEWQRRLGTRRLAWQVAWWQFQVRCQLRWVMWRQGPLAAAAVLERAATVFGEYCAHHSACPEYRVQSEPAAADSDTPAEAATPRGAPFLESVLVTLLSRLGYREADALALPLGRALLHYFTYWELEGRIELVNDEDAAQAIAFSEEADRLHESRLAAANALYAAQTAATA